MRKAILFVLASLITFSVYAKDQTVTIDGKNILVTEISEPGFGNSKIHSNDMKGGVYIIAGTVDSRFPNASNLIAERFKLLGIPVATSLENSSMAIQFNTMLALDMAKADRQAANSYVPNADQVIGGGIQMMGAVLSTASSAGGGATGLVGFIAGQLFNTDTKLVIAGLVAKNPIYTKGWGARGMRSSKNNGDSFGVARVFYKLEKGKEASDAVVLKMAIDQWIKRFVIFDTPVEPTETAEAVKAPATPVAQVVPAVEDTTKVTHVTDSE